MKPEEKAAIATGLTTGLITGGIAVMLGTPVALATAAWGTWKITKGVYDRTRMNNAPDNKH